MKQIHLLCVFFWAGGSVAGPFRAFSTASSSSHSITPIESSTPGSTSISGPSIASSSIQASQSTPLSPTASSSHSITPIESSTPGSKSISDPSIASSSIQASQSTPLSPTASSSQSITPIGSTTPGNTFTFGQTEVTSNTSGSSSASPSTTSDKSPTAQSISSPAQGVSTTSSLGTTSSPSTTTAPTDSTASWSSEVTSATSAIQDFVNDPSEDNMNAVLTAIKKTSHNTPDHDNSNIQKIKGNLDNIENSITANRGTPGAAIEDVAGGLAGITAPLAGLAPAAEAGGGGNSENNNSNDNDDDSTSTESSSTSSSTSSTSSASTITLTREFFVSTVDPGIWASPTHPLPPPLDVDAILASYTNQPLSSSSSATPSTSPPTSTEGGSSGSSMTSLTSAPLLPQPTSSEGSIIYTPTTLSSKGRILSWDSQTVSIEGSSTATLPAGPTGTLLPDVSNVEVLEGSGGNCDELKEHQCDWAARQFLEGDYGLNPLHAKTARWSGNSNAIGSLGLKCSVSYNCDNSADFTNYEVTGAQVYDLYWQQKQKGLFSMCGKVSFGNSCNITADVCPFKGCDAWNDGS